MTLLLRSTYTIPSTNDRRAWTISLMTNCRGKPTVSQKASPAETITKLRWITLEFNPGHRGEIPVHGGLSLIFPSSWLLRGVSWFKTDVSGQLNPLKMEPIDSPEILVLNRLTQRNNPEDKNSVQPRRKPTISQPPVLVHILLFT